MASLASINVIFGADLKQFSSEIQNASRELKKSGAQMQSIGNSLSLGITLPVLAAGAASIKMASDYTESLNKVDVAFKSSNAQVKEFAKNSLESFGIAEATALDMSANFGDMATSMGLTTSASAQMATSLVGLAGDLASFKNIGIDEATTALNGVFTGETESLKRLGIVMTEANLQTFALSKGIKTQVKDMDQASKVNLRYAYIMANTTNAQGDFVRTGGGAANQMRIFQESLKQLGQQFGSIILPAFTKAITYVNGMIKAFGNLSQGTKETIILFVGIAAAIGPLLTATGKLLTFLPNLAIAFKGVITSFKTLQAFAIANPYVALAAGIALVATGLYLWYSNQKQVVTSQQALNTAIAEGTKAATSEVASLDVLYKTATNVKLSINERKKAVDELQALYPAYFKNIKDEAILNGTASASYKQLRDDIFNKSRAIAIDGELQKRANDRVEEEVRFREKIVETENEINRLRKGPKNLISNASLKDNIAFLAKIKADFKKFTDDNLKADEVLFTAKEEYSKKSKKLTDDEKTGLDGIKTGVDAITSANERLIKSGTIEFFQAQIDGLQKLQKEQATTNGEWLKYQSNIDAIQVKIDALQNKGIKLPKPQVAEFDGIVPTFSLGNLEEQKSYYETQQKLFSTTSDEYQKYADLINGIQIKINAIQGVDESIAKVEEMKSSLISFNESISSAMTTAVASFAEGFGQVLSGLSGGATVLGSIGNLFLSTLAGLMEQVGKIAIETGLAILGIKTALKSLNPGVAIAAGVALIALSAVVKSQISDAGAFANGGIVGGTSVTGDKLFARVNSGEMILNKNQQRNLSNMINPAVSAGDVAVQLIGGFEIDGSKLRLVLDRSTASKNRKS